MTPKLAFILGIRPDVIRATLILQQLRQCQDLETVFIWSGQHYSDNLKSIFFRELKTPPAQIDLEAGGETDAEVVASVISRLYPVLREINPVAAVFLGDTNTTAGSIAAAQLNIPIVHIEGCMRSYDWRMPEEKYRTVTDHLSDVIYAYFDEYKTQGVREGLNPENIVVVGNPIVDILNYQYFSRRDFYDRMATDEFFSSRGLAPSDYYLMTCHRRENVDRASSLDAILNLACRAPHKVYFPASYRTQKLIRERSITVPPNLIVVDPIGYDEFLCLMVNSRGVMTDSGTVVEEACVLQVPSIQMRRSTERPQIYDAGGSVKFDPSETELYPADVVWAKLESLQGKTWEHGLGDGRSSERIATDLHRRFLEKNLARHKPEMYHIPVDRAYRDDGLSVSYDRRVE